MKRFPKDLSAEFFNEKYWERGGGDKPGYAGLATLEGMNRDMAREFVPIFGLAKGAKLLDLGCGGGYFVRSLLDLGIDAWGIDVSEYAIRQGRELYDLRDRIFVGSVHDLSRWKDETFDFIYSQQVFEHLPEEFTINLVKECFRVHKPGGHMWAGLVLRSYDIPADQKVSDRDPTHITVKHKDWWNDLFLQAGYRLCPDLEIRMVEQSDIWKKLRWHQLAYYRPGG